MWTRLLKYSTGRRPTLLRATWNHPYCPQPAHQTGAWHPNRCLKPVPGTIAACLPCIKPVPGTIAAFSTGRRPTLLRATWNHPYCPQPAHQTGAWHPNRCLKPVPGTIAACLPCIKPVPGTIAAWHHCGVPALCRVPGTQTGTGASPKPVPGKPVPGTCQRVAAQRWPARCWAADAKRVPGTIAARARCAGCLAPVVGTSCPAQLSSCGGTSYGSCASCGDGRWAGQFRRAELCCPFPPINAGWPQ